MYYTSTDFGEYASMHFTLENKNIQNPIESPLALYIGMQSTKQAMYYSYVSYGDGPYLESNSWFGYKLVPENGETDIVTFSLDRLAWMENLVGSDGMPIL